MTGVTRAIVRWATALRPYFMEEKPPHQVQDGEHTPEVMMGNERMGVESALDADRVSVDVKHDSDESENDTRVVDGDEATEKLLGWRSAPYAPSLHEVHSSIRVPHPSAPWYKQLIAFTGLGFLISVGYMDPGNWATDISAGSAYGYRLLIAILLANFAAIFLQSLALKLGIVAERDLAQACHDAYPPWLNYILWILAEIAIVATDLAEIIGSATALYLLFNVPLYVGVLVTVVDVLFILVFGTRNFRFLEILVFALCALIAGCFVYEIAAVSPDWLDVAKGLEPSPSIITNSGLLYNAIGILGATVMPHNIYLHSSIIQTRAYPRNLAGKKLAITYGSWDSSLALGVAFFVNAAILILASAAFHYGPNANTEVAYISDAYKLIAPAVGSNAARILFGVALLASGQNSTITGTLAGQVVMEGFIQVSLKPWFRRLITRVVAIIPAAIVAGVAGNAGAGKLLVLSQVILSLQLTFAIAPLVHFTSSRSKMGTFVNGWVTHVVAIVLVGIIAVLNIYLVFDSIREDSFGSTSEV
eukprot:TRINITY_DN2350_c0_g2_i3.p1 TRINITY_DN2350_c0_g2~~TRINITY_DN2350_c0_g2_i3.p1  ORF type:complete len:532 (+),score=38.12 TRINITY_DN2350_c0_g2_i3:290-1885(+)